MVSGGGPTGVETAAVCIPSFLYTFRALTRAPQEIYDFCQEDIMNYVGPFISERVVSYALMCYHQFPKLCREEVSIHVIQSREHILNTVRLSDTQSKNGSLMFTVF